MFPGRRTSVPRVIGGVVDAGGGGAMFSCVQLTTYPNTQATTTNADKVLKLMNFMLQGFEELKV
jgi:hypothetical protein